MTSSSEKKGLQTLKIDGIRKFAKEAHLPMLDFKPWPYSVHWSKLVPLRNNAFLIKAVPSVLSVKMVPRTSTTAAKGLLQEDRKP